MDTSRERGSFPDDEAEQTTAFVLWGLCRPDHARRHHARSKPLALVLHGLANMALAWLVFLVHKDEEPLAVARSIGQKQRPAFSCGAVCPGDKVHTV